MKKLLVCALMSVSTAFAATTVKTSREGVNTKAIAANAEVVGSWVSTERTAAVTPGSITLTADGSATLAPEGFDPLIGKYLVQGQFLDITNERGHASFIYKITKNTMSVQYEDGSFQSFTKKESAAPASAIPSQKKVTK